MSKASILNQELAETQAFEEQCRRDFDDYWWKLENDEEEKEFDFLLEQYESEQFGRLDLENHHLEMYLRREAA